jgi:hypothetical protein
MSLRRLYKSIPTNQRLCTYFRCQHPVLRNIDRDKEGRIWHHGCLMAAQDERYRCLECYLCFNAVEAAWETTEQSFNEDFQKRIQVVCPGCGSTNLKSLGGG